MANQEKIFHETDPDDRKLPRSKALMYSAVTGASISIIVYVVYVIVNCGCN